MRRLAFAALAAAALLTTASTPALAFSVPVVQRVPCARFVGHGAHRHARAGFVAESRHGRLRCRT